MGSDVGVGEEDRDPRLGARPERAGVAEVLREEDLVGKIHRVDPDFGSTLTFSNSDSQSNCWVNWKIVGQPCEFQVCWVMFRVHKVKTIGEAVRVMWDVAMASLRFVGPVRNACPPPPHAGASQGPTAILHCRWLALLRDLRSGPRLLPLLSYFRQDDSAAPRPAGDRGARRAGVAAQELAAAAGRELEVLRLRARFRPPGGSATQMPTLTPEATGAALCAKHHQGWYRPEHNPMVVRCLNKIQFQLITVYIRFTYSLL
jgi:hypothetical protein